MLNKEMASGELIEMMDRSSMSHGLLYSILYLCTGYTPCNTMMNGPG